MNKYLIVLCLFLKACSPNCKERGGIEVQNGFFYVMQSVGNVHWMQQYPNYECVIKDKNG